jgi:FtsP/CotA-like multicopper oxidase with cupredoxin domain
LPAKQAPLSEVRVLDQRFTVPLRSLRLRGRAWVVTALAGAAVLVCALPSGAATPKGPAAKAPAAKKGGLKPVQARPGRRVEYWVGAVPTTWNVVPTGRDPLTDTSYEADRTTMQAVIYRRYTADWRNQLPPGYGLVGPVIQAQVGDTIVVHFKNFDPNASHSMHFHGVDYQSASDGAYIPNVSGAGADVKPGQSFTYRLVAGADSAGVWPYYDHGPSMEQSIERGLYGALSIRPRGQPRPDREFVVFLGRQQNLDTVDGLAFINNTPTFRARVGELVQWDVLGLGDGHHSFHVHGHRWSSADGPRDVRTVGPGESFVLRWRETKPGSWLYHCHVQSHMANGMIGLYVVTR